MELASDSSWRVRYTTVTQIGDICGLFDHTVIESKLVPAFLHLIQDPELEVRTGASMSISKICYYLEPSFIVTTMMKSIANLAVDSSEHVRIGFANEILSIAK